MYLSLRTRGWTRSAAHHEHIWEVTPGKTGTMPDEKTVIRPFGCGLLFEGGD